MCQRSPCKLINKFQCPNNLLEKNFEITGGLKGVKKALTLQSQGANHQNQYHFEANLANPLYLFSQSPGNGQCLEQHGRHHLYRVQQIVQLSCHLVVALALVLCSIKKKKPWVQTTHKYNLWDKIFHEQKLYGIADDDNKMHTGASKSS